MPPEPRKAQAQCNQEANDMLAVLGLGPAKAQRLRQTVIDRMPSVELKRKFAAMDLWDTEMVHEIAKLADSNRAFWRSVQAIGGDVDERLL